MKLLILGLGYSAGFFARAALARGWEVTGTVRSAERAAELSREGIRTLVFGGFAVSTALAKAVAEAEAVLVSVQPAEDGDPVLQRLRGDLAAANEAFGKALQIENENVGLLVDRLRVALKAGKNSEAKALAQEIVGRDSSTMLSTQVIAPIAGSDDPDFKRALRDLGLIRCVGGQKFRALDQMIHGRRNVMLVGAASDEKGHRACRDILRSHLRQRALHIDLAFVRRERQQSAQLLVGGNVGKQRIDIGYADAGEHCPAVFAGEREVAHDGESAL